MKYEKYLPMGSVVMLKEGKKRIMITGFCLQTEDGKQFDYTGCLYPEGYMTSENVIVFNHSDISKIYCIGYSDNEEKEFKEDLKREMKEV